MKNNALHHIGHTKKAHGTKGELKAHVEDRYLEDFAQATVLFLEIHGKPLPFFVQKIEVQADLIIHFEDVDSREAASQFAGKKILLRETDLIPEEQRQFEVVSNLEYAFLEGFQLVDVEVGAVGEILAVEEFPQQEMAFVSYQDGEIMIPLNPFIIEKIDQENQVVEVHLPAGLLDM